MNQKVQHPFITVLHVADCTQRKLVCQEVTALRSNNDVVNPQNQNVPFLQVVVTTGTGSPCRHPVLKRTLLGKV